MLSILLAQGTVLFNLSSAISRHTSSMFKKHTIRQSKAFFFTYVRCSFKANRCLVYRQTGMELIQVATGIMLALTLAGILMTKFESSTFPSLQTIAKQLPVYLEQHSAPSYLEQSSLSDDTFAGWSKSTSEEFTFTLSFHAPEATHIPSDEHITGKHLEAQFSIPSQIPVRNEFEFLGWSEQDMLSEEQPSNQLIEPNDVFITSFLRTDLYAQWNDLRTWAILYQDGTLILQRGNKKNTEDIAAHGAALSSFTDFEHIIASNPQQVAWSSHFSSITTIIVRDSIAPASTVYWFSECPFLEIIEGEQWIQSSL